MAGNRFPRDVRPRRLEAYERLVATQPGVERKGANLPYTSTNGHMTSFVDPSGIAIRLAPDDRVMFIDRFGARLHEAHGATMKEFVTVPDDLLENVSAVAEWFARGIAHVTSLPPKKSARKRG